MSFIQLYITIFFSKTFFSLKLQELPLVVLQLQEKISFLKKGFSFQSGLGKKYVINLKSAKIAVVVSLAVFLKKYVYERQPIQIFAFRLDCSNFYAFVALDSVLY